MKQKRYSLAKRLLFCGLAAAALTPQTEASTVLNHKDDPLAYGAVKRILVSAPPAVGKQGMVVSAQHLATDAGVQILAEGGNAVDAAVATVYALAVVYPAAGNIGGGGFATVHLPNGHTTFIDFRERAPLAASATMYQDADGNVIPNASVFGWKAVAIPGTVSGMETLERRWGRLTRAQVMAPAIRLAEKGFRLTQADVNLLNTKTAMFLKDPYARKIFLHADGSPLKVGELLVQKDLAHSLKLIAHHGPSAFYDGEIAKELVDASQKGGGILQLKDFQNYHVREFAPVHCMYRGYSVDTAPPPSGGGVALCEMLNILSGYNLKHEGLRSVAGVRHQAEAMRHAYSDRRDLGDPAFVHDPIAHLIDLRYAAEIRADLPKDHAVNSLNLVAGLPQPDSKVEAQPVASHEKNETTQLSTADRSGYAVAITYTLNGWFGSCVVGGKTGMMMNDEMDDFSTKPGVPNMYGIVGSQANAIAPGKTPLSSMSPTIISRDGKVVMVIGSPGGSRIPTIVLSVVLGVIDGGLNIQQAIDMPRIHEQWLPSDIDVEPYALKPEVVKQLTKEGYQISNQYPWGLAQGILVGAPMLDAPSTNLYYGGTDHRHGGSEAKGF